MVVLYCCTVHQENFFLIKSDAAETTNLQRNRKEAIRGIAVYLHLDFNKQTTKQIKLTMYKPCMSQLLQSTLN